MRLPVLGDPEHDAEKVNLRNFKENVATFAKMETVRDAYGDAIVDTMRAQATELTRQLKLMPDLAVLPRL
jgi:hypothetical protein